MKSLELESNTQAAGVRRRGSLIEVEAMEKRFSEEVLLEMVRSASRSIGQAQKLEEIINLGIERPSRVWRYHYDVWTKPEDRDARATATAWKGESVAVLVEAVAAQDRKLACAQEEERVESSAPNNEPDVTSLAKTWIQIGEIEERQGNCPVGFNEKIDTVLEKLEVDLEHFEESRPAYTTAVCVQALCEIFGVSFSEGIKNIGTLHQTMNSSEVPVVVIEMKNYAKGECFHGAALMQAAKHLHLSGRSEGSIAAMWAFTSGDAMFLSYRLGTVSWANKTVISTKVRNLTYFKGGHFDLKKWAWLFGLFEAAKHIALFETKGDPEIPVTEL